MYIVIPRATTKKDTKRYSKNTIGRLERGTKNVQRTQKGVRKKFQRNKNQKEQKENDKMIDLHLTISIITLD